MDEASQTKDAIQSVLKNLPKLAESNLSREESERISEERSIAESLHDSTEIAKGHHLECGLGPRHIEATADLFACEPWTQALNKLTDKLRTGFLAGLVGLRGTGKTQMASALIINCLKPRLISTSHYEYDYEKRDHVTKTRKRYYTSSAKYITAMDIFLCIRSTYKPASKATEESVIAEMTSPKLLVIDEVQERSNTEFEDRILTHIVDIRYCNKLDTLLISNLLPDEFAKSVGPSIASRCNETGGIIECAWESFRK